VKRLCAILALVCTIAVATAVLNVPGDAALTGKIVLTATIVEHHQQGAFPGAVDTWRYSLTSIRRTPSKPFGYMVLVCHRISDDNTLRQCVGTASLPRGKITVSGSFLYTNLWSVAVTGGTDDYTGVAGLAAYAQIGKSASASLTFKLT
jgi:hypothetical protein